MRGPRIVRDMKYYYNIMFFLWLYAIGFAFKNFMLLKIKNKK